MKHTRPPLVMDGLLPWYCYNDVGAYRAVAPWYEGMVRMARRWRISEWYGHTSGIVFRVAVEFFGLVVLAQLCTVLG